MSRVFAILAAVLLSAALLAVGLYAGAHPGALPGSVQDALGVDKQQQVVQEAMDTIEKTYYRKLTDDELANASISGMVKSLKDRFSTTSRRRSTPSSSRRPTASSPGWG